MRFVLLLLFLYIGPVGYPPPPTLTPVGYPPHVTAIPSETPVLTGTPAPVSTPTPRATDEAPTAVKLRSDLKGSSVGVVLPILLVIVIATTIHLLWRRK